MIEEETESQREKWELNASGPKRWKPKCRLEAGTLMPAGEYETRC